MILFNYVYWTAEDYMAVNFYLFIYFSVLEGMWKGIKSHGPCSLWRTVVKFFYNSSKIRA